MIIHVTDEAREIAERMIKDSREILADLRFGQIYDLEIALGASVQRWINSERGKPCAHCVEEARLAELELCNRDLLG